MLFSCLPHRYFLNQNMVLNKVDAGLFLVIKDKFILISNCFHISSIMPKVMILQTERQQMSLATIRNCCLLVALRFNIPVNNLSVMSACRVGLLLPLGSTLTQHGVANGNRPQDLLDSESDALPLHHHASQQIVVI